MAMIEPNYAINIARKNDSTQLYHHYCKVELGCVLYSVAEEKFKELCSRFPAEEGWSLLLDKIDCFSKTIESNI